MYLFRAPNCTYYTRICLPKKLRDNGFPFDLKVSLLTKNRQLASERNLTVAARLKDLIFKTHTQSCVEAFKASSDAIIKETRCGFDSNQHHKEVSVVPVRSAERQDVTSTVHRKDPPVVSLKAALDAFVESKKLQNVRPLTVHQLDSRVRHCINLLPVDSIDAVTSAHALLYRDQLLREGRSYKTNKEYLAAAFQFFKYAKTMNYIAINPFDGIKIDNKPRKPSSAERDRWSVKNLKLFFKSHKFTEQGVEFRWISWVLLYSGMRPSEVCQLRVSDIKEADGGYYFAVNVDDEGKYVKNSNSIRKVPVHGQLIKLGLLEYLLTRKSSGANNLFSYEPKNIFGDWSKAYINKMTKYQTSIGMQPGHRPTSYGFRHTFIDELKQKGISEIITAEIVGHKQQGITYDRYGKQLNLKELAKALNKVTFKL
ncbi:tyrosine-type recombinase/integrase [Vibrio agarivorans]|uniref:Tyrosine-type recombinase/integrase n=1 Tax=Vibrio agarivorans TaxID=153622 RepID=A0ABT7Y0Z4_9VIBR|nr:tyrosine-type recombinase/integrase [Vibrio agarivorans]MDN2481667.1 tyrosine-type recombinase/integrase [Vibrio agarivorans]